MKKIYFSIAMLSLVLVMNGCGANPQNIKTQVITPDGPADDQGYYNITNGRTKNYIQPPQTDDGNNLDDDTDEFQNKLNSTKKRAKKIADAVEIIEEIENAYVVVTGNTAIIGINLIESLSDTQIISLKHIIEDEVREIDPDIGHIAVTASPELVERIMNMSGGNKDKSELRQNLDDDIFFRVAPTI